MVQWYDSCFGCRRSRVQIPVEPKFYHKPFKIRERFVTIPRLRNNHQSLCRTFLLEQVLFKRKVANLQWPLGIKLAQKDSLRIELSRFQDISLPQHIRASMPLYNQCLDITLSVCAANSFDVQALRLTATVVDFQIGCCISTCDRDVLRIGEILL